MHSFSKAYDFRINPEMPGDRPASELLFFPKDLGVHGKVGLKVEFITADGTTWVGLFKEGYKSGEVVTGVFPTPSETFVCVIAQGQGYVIDVTNPDGWNRISVFPIMSIAESASERCLVFADHTKLGVLSEGGSQWGTDRIASDELRILDLSGHIVKLEGWKAEEDRHSRFDFDLRSRKLVR
jgi:hypothetical protein